jgi:hypothetical protein
MKFFQKVGELENIPTGFWYKDTKVEEEGYRRFSTGFDFRWGAPCYDDFDMKMKPYTYGFRISFTTVRKKEERRSFPEVAFWKVNDGKAFRTKEWFSRKLWRSSES